MFTWLDVCLAAELTEWPCPTRQGEKLSETLQVVRFARLRRDKDLEVYLYLEALRYI